MPRQMQGIELTDNNDGTVNVQIGPFGQTMLLSDLFDRTLDDEQIRQNMRLAFLIGGYAHPNSAEFLRQINNNGNGMEGRRGKTYIVRIDLEDQDSQTYRVWFDARRNGDGQFGVAVTLEFLRGDDLDQQVIVANIASHLRVGGHSSLTSAAINSVRAAKFWY